MKNGRIYACLRDAPVDNTLTSQVIESRRELSRPKPDMFFL